MDDNKILANIITIYDPSPNYGNRLQNYAVQEVLHKLGVEVVTLSFEKSICSLKIRIKYYLQLITGGCLANNRAYWKAYIPKVFAFDRFNKKYIKTRNITRMEEIEDSDFFIVGSDQVWNPTWYDSHPLKKYLYLLTFTEVSKKVCFSPSFGVSKLSEEWKPWFKEHLSGFRDISVRENAGARIIKELIDKDAVVLIDPTLMLDREQWRKISKKPCRKANASCPYIFTYFLGDVSQKVQADISRIAADKKYEVLHLMNVDTPALYASGPGEFIYLLDHAELILTDSFHACVFAFLFGKPFLVYSREGHEADMMSRINTFLETFDLERKYVNSGIENELMECDYKTGYHILQAEQKKVIGFLKKSMNMK